MNFEPLKQLDVNFDSSKDFWEKTTDERYQYFKNACFSQILFLKTLQAETRDEQLCSLAAMQFANICTLLVYLMTTDEERESDIEMKWLNKIQKETNQLIMVSTQQQGEA